MEALDPGKKEQEQEKSVELEDNQSGCQKGVWVKEGESHPLTCIISSINGTHASRGCGLTLFECLYHREYNEVFCLCRKETASSTGAEFTRTSTQH